MHKNRETNNKNQNHPNYEIQKKQSVELPTIFNLEYTVKPRFWNTFAAKILFINRFFAADQNL